MATYRPVRADDVWFLDAMLVEAAFWRPEDEPPDVEDALADDRLARYVDDWGRPGDAGVIAEIGMGRIGAVWWRLFPAERPGFGFVDPATPELSMAVMTEERGMGVGTALLAASLREAAAEGHRAISLSVSKDNPVRALYQRTGFRVVDEEHGSLTMIYVIQQ